MAERKPMVSLRSMVPAMWGFSQLQSCRFCAVSHVGVPGTGSVSFLLPGEQPGLGMASTALSSAVRI